MILLSLWMWKIFEPSKKCWIWRWHTSKSEKYPHVRALRLVLVVRFPAFTVTPRISRNGVHIYMCCGKTASELFAISFLSRLSLYTVSFFSFSVLTPPDLFPAHLLLVRAPKIVLSPCVLIPLLARTFFLAHGRLMLCAVEKVVYVHICTTGKKLYFSKLNARKKLVQNFPRFLM